MSRALFFAKFGLLSGEIWIRQGQSSLRADFGLLRSSIGVRSVTNGLKCVVARRGYSEKSPVFVKSENKPVFSEEELADARKKRLEGLGPYVSKLPASWVPYAELMRLEKPVGTWLLFLPGTWAVTMAAMEVGASLGSTLFMLGLFGLGSVIMRGAGCTINDLLDRNLDNKVIRSVERPIASGRVSPRNAVLFLGAQTAVGMGILAQLPASCWWLGLASLPIVFTYPLFKRFTYYPQVALSACFNWAALLGFPAMGIMDWATMVPMYTATFLWCMIYDTIYAHQDKKFDVKAGIKSTALAWGNKTKTISNTMAVAQISSMVVAGINSGLIMGPGFIGGLTIFTYRLFTMIKTVDLDDPSDCWKKFNENINTGLYFSYALFFDYLLRLFGIL